MKNEGVKHNNTKFLTSGLHVRKPHPYLEATPDDIFSIKYHTIKEACKKTTLLELFENKIPLKRNHQYYTQIIEQMALMGCNQIYFVV